MSVIIVNGTPGKGKTLNLTREAISQYRKDNSFLNRITRKIKGLPARVNYIYSSYPILLDRRRKIYSHKVGIYDLTLYNRFPVNTSIYIMEIQLSYDSTEYSSFPDIIAAFLQAHRHAGIRNIYFDSQSMSRIIKKMRIIACERWQILWTIHINKIIPFIPLGITRYKISYDTEEERTTDLENEKRIRFFNTRRVSNAYDTCCLAALWDYATPFDKGCYDDLKMSYSDIYQTYFRDKAYKKRLSEVEVFNADKLARKENNKPDSGE